ncbi:LuxR C-terminal-related transcriptional regulator [Roseobacter sinensis]|uniref:LuxR C-terminal-related transcriptional regulator n=1 Tax=Roseobacter sinensis TaxID=2931391 RepID=A0ABT3BLP8_9RHOB|nr:LuxR C-terminal-related transcriptional regulator [Roseobacter sp. WL0113]MCV3274079.1 LuxR C-terminal-related transcriptional regulator [Roseobacter sp. WL0113]
MNEDQVPTNRTHDVADLLADHFPGHTMQRMRTPDGKYRYIYVSSGIQNSFGLNPDELMKADAVDHGWIHPDERAQFVEALELSAHDLTPLDIEVRVEAPDGAYRWVRSLGQPRREDDGTVIWDGVALDITDRREALDALERALSEARRSEVAEGRLNYIAAQDLAAPLSALRSAITALTIVDTENRADVEACISDVSDRFGTFEKALLATRGLVLSGKSQPTSGASEIDPKLTKRQREILVMIRKGASNLEIADQLGISEGTVKLHVSAILKRLGVRNRTEAARL